MSELALPNEEAGQSPRALESVDEMNRWLLDCLDILVSLGRDLNLDPASGSPSTIYDTTKTALRRVIAFETLGFMVTDEEGLDFQLSAWEPGPRRAIIEAEIERHIEEGTFAYVLSQNRPLIFPALTLDKRTVILHVLATQARIVGMFLGVTTEGSITDAAQKLISAILFHCASALEATRFYNRLNAYAHDLEQQIEERKKTQQVLRESQEMLQSVMNHIPLAIFWKDTSGRYLGGNRRFAEDAGLRTTGEIAGKTARELFGDGLAETHEKAEALVLRTNSALLNVEELAGVKDGKEVWHRASRVPLHDVEGNTKAVLVIYEDISGQRRALTERMRLEAQLRQGQKLEAIGTLAGGIAHDFNNILSAIIGYAELGLAENETAGAVRENLEEVFRAAQRAKDLVKQILTFGRQIEPDRKPVQIHEIAREALKLLRASLPATIEIESSLDDGSGYVLADETQIHQIIINLCTNAYHAMRSSGGVLTVTVDVVRRRAEHRQGRPDLQAGEYVRLQVHDTGCGMRPEVLERIFEPFFTTKPVGEGTGMGLAIVHGIMQGLNGVINVESESGRGATFELLFPRIPSAAIETAAALETRGTGSERVLFVDDEEVLATLGKRSLERLGYTVTLRTSSVEALELFKSKPQDFDVLITDQTMPNMTGLQLAEEVQQIRPDIPVIIATGFSETLENHGHITNVARIVMKPFLASEMHEAIRSVVGSKSDARPKSLGG